MTGPSATCELWVDGVRVADAGSDLTAGRVTALSSITLAWGRDGAQEQPGPATLAFELIDPSGAESALDIVHVGSWVDIWAVGSVETTSDPISTYDDGQFTTAPDGPVPSSEAVPYATAGGVTPKAEYRSQTFVLIPGRFTGPLGHGVRIPPRDFSPAGQLPNAWDSIPRARPGESWEFAFSALIPAGLRFWAWPAFYATPYEGGGTTAQETTGEIFDYGTGEWVDYTFTVDIASLGDTGTDSAWAALGFTFDYDPADDRGWDDQGDTVWATAPSTWNDWELYGLDLFFDNLAIYPPPTTSRGVLSFSGPVSDLTASPSPDGSLRVSGTATDVGGELGNKIIGDSPWPVQPMGTRAARIMTLAGLSPSQLLIDAPLSNTSVSYRDVDAQPVYSLLQDLAQSVGGVLWAATHAVSGPYLRIENPDGRASVRRLVEDTEGGVITIIGFTSGSLLSACDILEDPVTWKQSTEDVSTVATVSWLEQTTDDAGLPAPTERTYTETDTAGVARFGTRRLSISTELTTQADAASLAGRALALARVSGWRLDGINHDTASVEDEISSLDDTTREITLMTLLDGTTRMGMPLTLIDMPTYSPTGGNSSVYVEGGRYRYEEGYWSLELTTTPSTGAGSSASWEQTKTADPDWKWSQFDPPILWGDLYGVTV